MGLTTDQIRLLLEGFRNNSLTREEHQQLFLALEDNQHDPELKQFLDEVLHEQEAHNTQPEPELDWDTLYDTIKASTPPTRAQTSTPIIRRWWAAASVALVLLSGAYLWFTQPTTQPKPLANNNQPATIDVAPGKNGAILTLADGTQMVLDSLGNGLVATQNGTEIVLNNGELSYNATTTTSTTNNTVSTPNGRQFTLLLPDGTRVWLNAASSITYPTAFTGSERRVSVTGETYFEVAKDRTKPFIVKTPDEEISVLGTHFNINAYPDEPQAVITLVEGAIRVNKHTMQPGYSYTNGQLTPANTEQAVAWKNGVFNFHRLSLTNVMRQLSRWYDIDVTYAPNAPEITVGGKMGRDLNLSQVLEVLAEMQVHYKMDGKTITILP